MSRAFITASFLLITTVSAHAADALISRIEIKSSWGGLGQPQKTELLIRNDSGEYRLGSTRIDHASVESLSASIHEPVQVKPTLENLGMTEEWLKRTAEKLERDADGNDGSDSTLYKLSHGSDAQKWIFRHSYNDPTFMKKVLPEI